MARSVFARQAKVLVAVRESRITRMTRITWKAIVVGVVALSVMKV